MRYASCEECSANGGMLARCMQVDVRALSGLPGVGSELIYSRAFRALCMHHTVSPHPVLCTSTDNLRVMQKILFGNRHFA